MNASNPLLAVLGVATLAGAPAHGQPQDDDAGTNAADRPISLTLGSGIEYDSNVAVLELDANSNASDNALLLDFGVGYDRPNDGPFDIQAGYDFSDLLHDELDEFDVRTHRGSSTLSYDFGSHRHRRPAHLRVCRARRRRISDADAAVAIRIQADRKTPVPALRVRAHGQGVRRQPRPCRDRRCVVVRRLRVPRRPHDLPCDRLPLR